MENEISFEVFSKSSFDTDKNWESTAGNQKITCDIPTEFHGKGAGASPEDLYGLALVNCYIATFKVIAKNSLLRYEDILGRSKVTIGKDESGQAWMEKVQIDINLRGASDYNKANRLLEMVKKRCMIINSVKSDVRIFTQVLGN